MRKSSARRATYFVYLVRCVDGTHYCGSTINLEARIKLHNAGNGAKYLRGRGPVRLVYSKQYRYYKNVLRAERYLKRQTRAYKEELIRIYAARNTL